MAAGEQRVSLNGSRALSHVYIQHPPLRCNIPETQGLYYDDGNKLILSPTSGQVLSWKMGSVNQSEPPCSDSIGEGPVLFIRYSLDKKVIAIQRSNHEVEFRNRETGDTFIQIYKPESENILGFFWTDCPTCDFVLIKTCGLELLIYEHGFNRLRLVETKRLNVSWYVHTHESRMVLLASGMQCKIFSGFQFSCVGIVCLPKFEMKMLISEANHKPVLSSEDVNIVTIYGRIYCLQFDRVDMHLHIYRFYRDAIVHQGRFPVYSTRIAVSVVDNVLLVHQVDAKVVILYDIFFDSLSPISAPLPLLVRGTIRGIPSSSQLNTRQTTDVVPNSLSAYEGSIFGDSWRFLVPDLICDADHGLIWKIQLDLEAISACSSEVHSVFEFLQRRRSEPSKVKQLCLAMMRSIILERRPISSIATTINALVVSYSKDIKFQNASQRGGARIFSDNPVSYTTGNVSESIVETQGRLTDEKQNQVGSSSHKYGNIESDQSIDINLASTTNSQPVCSDSNSDETTKLEQKKSISEDCNVKQASYNSIGSSVSSEIVTNSLGIKYGSDSSQAQSHSEITQNSQQSSNSLASTLLNLKDSSATSVSISPYEVYYFILSLVEEAMTGDPSYLIAVIIVFLQSFSLEKLKVPQNIYVMTIKLLASSDRFAELGMFVTNKILEPSKEVAFQLIETGHKQSLKLGMDMLRHLLLHHEYVQVLTEHGYHLQALNYAKKNKVIITEPSIYLEAALSNNNFKRLTALVRFFSDFVPGFQTSTDHNKYHHIIIGAS